MHRPLDDTLSCGHAEDFSAVPQHRCRLVCHLLAMTVAAPVMVMRDQHDHNNEHDRDDAANDDGVDQKGWRSPSRATA